MLSVVSGSRFRAKQTSWNTKGGGGGEGEGGGGGGGEGGGGGGGGQMGEDKNKANLFDALFCFILILECLLNSLRRRTMVIFMKEIINARTI